MEDELFFYQVFIEQKLEGLIFLRSTYHTFSNAIENYLYFYECKLFETCVCVARASSN